jgi:hypothetical protein
MAREDRPQQHPSKQREGNPNQQKPQQNPNRANEEKKWREER